MNNYFIRASFLYLFLLVFISGSWAQADLFYYLPEDITYNENIPTPKSIIGHEIGEWHITHDKLMYYLYNLGEASERVKVEKIGQTYEYRPLLNVIITSEENHKKLDQIRREHLKLSDPEVSDKLEIQNMPVVIRLGYSIHGNEPSGA
ncbi:MAG: zinc carboxypeptidase, partial [Cyclobacteriaceae bacterium]|nr:zinc carboxypeptidase [Cyclobacteriaceae bacterium]